MSDEEKPKSEATRDELAAYAANVKRRKRRLAEEPPEE